MQHISARPRRTRMTLLAGLIGVGIVFVCPLMAGTINSTLQIEGGKTFALGGGQEGAFKVTGRNTGPVAVEVLGQAEGEPAVTRGTVAPGGALEARFAEGEMALLRNTSGTSEATLKLKISGDTSALGMSYRDN